MSKKRKLNANNIKYKYGINNTHNYSLQTIHKVIVSCIIFSEYSGL